MLVRRTRCELLLFYFLYSDLRHQVLKLDDNRPKRTVILLAYKNNLENTSQKQIIIFVTKQKN